MRMDDILSDDIVIRSFQTGDQAACRALVLAGLEEHWGRLNPALNPDLEDIGTAFETGCFLTAWCGTELVGTGGFTLGGADCVQIARMSVRRDLRGQGVGRRILAGLLTEARRRGAARVILETTESWEGAVRFYLAAGFRVSHRQDGDIYFEKELAPCA
jgi:GNAT superfamily N-acetyltransferase